MIYYIPFFTVPMFCGVTLTWIIRHWAIKMNIVNKPNPIIPQHIKPVAYLGGVAILLSIIIAVIYAYYFQSDLLNQLYKPYLPIIAITRGAVGYLALGVYDDLKQLKALPKFICQLILAVICVLLGIQTNLFHIFYFDFLFSIFWIVLIVNALNFTDVCDGLVAGICVITFLTVGILNTEFRTFSFLISGTTLGFLFFNLPRASIFLGDAGSHLLGFILAALAISGSQNLSLLDAAVWMWLLCSVPLFELIFITSIRVYKGKPWWKGSPDHFSLRLQKAGLSRLQIDFLAGGISVCIVTIGCIFHSFPLWLKYTTLSLVALLYVAIWIILLKWEVKNEPK